jgi:CDP-paratose 2-epimerase
VNNPEANVAQETVAVVFGGAGFIGSNLSDALAMQGRRVRVFDNLSRPGVEKNLNWLVDRHGDQIEVFENDIRDGRAVRLALAGAKSVFQLAGQVAVTSSMEDPCADLDVNVRGTVNVLDELRKLNQGSFFAFTSTNKVYGDLEQVELSAHASRYEPDNVQLRRRGFSEELPLSFRTPYGCSKGAADQYVLDYARSFNMKNVVFRMSCIYGPRQFGTEDQGWVAHFLIRAMSGQPITIFGDGKQVRDLLNVSDLIRAFLTAESQQEAVAGQAFNMGGGVRNMASVSEVLAQIENLVGHKLDLPRGPWRVADQKYYVSDTTKFETTTGWKAQVSVQQGLAQLHRWLEDNRELLALGPGPEAPRLAVAQ